jgi:tetratricopeptide (TPR) repeat protein
MIELSGWLEEFEYIQDAVSYAKRAAALSPTRAYYLRRAAELLNRHGEHRSAIDLLRAATRIEADNQRAWMELAEALFAAGDDTAATEACNKVLSLQPDHWEAKQLLKQLAGSVPAV